MTDFLEVQERITDRIEDLTAIIKRLNDARDRDAATIRALCHDVELQTARAEVAEALLRGRANDDD